MCDGRLLSHVSGFDLIKSINIIQGGPKVVIQ